MGSESLGIRLIETASADTTITRLSKITGIIEIEQVFPDSDEPDLVNLYIAIVNPSNLYSALLLVSAVPNVKDAWIHPPRKLMDAKLVLHHDDPPCTSILMHNGLCPICNFVPDMQSTCFYFYCPACKIQLKKMKCPSCKQVFKNPSP